MKEIVSENAVKICKGNKELVIHSNDLKPYEGKLKATDIILATEAVDEKHHESDDVLSESEEMGDDGCDEEPTPHKTTRKGRLVKPPARLDL